MKSFLRDEEGQDLIEYSLLIAFVALASAALFIGSGQSVKGVWTVANSQLAKGGCQNWDGDLCVDNLH